MINLMLTTCTSERPNATSAQAGAHAGAHLTAELIDGLGARQATISPKFLYDPLGSKLFEAICELPEYYPTRTEAGIFERHGREIAHACGIGATMIDLGAGNCAKAASLFPLLRPAQYVAVDISTEFVSEALARLRLRFPHIDMRALGLDFSNGLELPEDVREEQRLFFYPGSSLGNFTPPEARAFLTRLRKSCGDDGALLIGIDLAKDKDILDAAYDDALGVTAAFNLNVLRHVNSLLGSDFDVKQWRHVGFYNEAAGRVEMHLEAKSAQRVRWAGGGRDFAAGERIHTENSYKYRQADAIHLLEQSGFEATRVWTDPRCPFAVIHAQALS
jgi:dimethylhistidine N-methyltransferase